MSLGYKAAQSHVPLFLNFLFPLISAPNPTLPSLSVFAVDLLSHPRSQQGLYRRLRHGHAFLSFP
jgi:hypothetical protein